LNASIQWRFTSTLRSDIHTHLGYGFADATREVSQVLSARLDALPALDVDAERVWQRPSLGESVFQERRCVAPVVGRLSRRAGKADAREVQAMREQRV
jgi:hypothetical protein